MLCDEQFNISLLYFILVQSVVFYVKDIALTSTSLIVSAVKMTELKLVKILKLQSSINEFFFFFFRLAVNNLCRVQIQTRAKATPSNQ